jgi:hypothetical protein
LLKYILGGQKRSKNAGSGNVEGLGKKSKPVIKLFCGKKFGASQSCGEKSRKYLNLKLVTKDEIG